MKKIAEHWQKILFAAFGFIPLYFCFSYLRKGDITGVGVTFSIAFLSFLYSNLSQFKRIKGFGFEAERWEDKQKEAEILIDRLKNVVEIYSNQIVMHKITQNRWGGGSRWQEVWALFDELTMQHISLGQSSNIASLFANLCSWDDSI